MGFVYIPKFTPQINPADKFGGVNCGAYATSYAVDRATMGGIQVSGAVVRRATNEPIPDPGSPGLNIPQLVHAVFGWHVQLNDRTGAPWSALMAALHEHRGVVLSGDYDQIPSKYSGQVGFKGDHSVYVNHLSNDGNELWWLDPLHKAGGFYIPAAIAKAYAEKYAKTIGTYPGLAFITTRQTPSLATAP